MKRFWLWLCLLFTTGWCAKHACKYTYGYDMGSCPRCDDESRERRQRQVDKIEQRAAQLKALREGRL